MPNKSNKGVVPILPDPRAKYVPVGCGQCMECRKQKKRQWQVRLHEEIRQDITGKFVTLSFSEENLAKLENEILKEYPHTTGYDLDNETATLAVRRFLERWRKATGKSVKHWLVTELGQVKTERLHLHGILFSNDLKTLKETWQYGNVWIGSYVSERTVNYIVKYIHKTDVKHPNYTPKILTSKGIGMNYMNREDSKKNAFKDQETKEYYYTRQGLKLPLPIYYRNKIYTADQREKLWLNLLDKEERYVNGIRCDMKKGPMEYYQLVTQARELNKRLGYGGIKKWDQIQYEKARREFLKEYRHNKVKDG